MIRLAALRLSRAAMDMMEGWPEGVGVVGSADQAWEPAWWWWWSETRASGYLAAWWW
jgi:hypothetical protein